MTDPTDKDRERARAWAEDEDAHEYFNEVAHREAVASAEHDGGYPLSQENLWSCAAEGGEIGYAQGQADERARIVAALRKRAELGWSGEDHWSDWDLLEGAADDLERGEL